MEEKSLLSHSSKDHLFCGRRGSGAVVLLINCNYFFSLRVSQASFSLWGLHSTSVQGFHNLKESTLLFPEILKSEVAFSAFSRQIMHNIVITWV